MKGTGKKKNKSPQSSTSNGNRTSSVTPFIIHSGARFWSSRTKCKLNIQKIVQNFILRKFRYRILLDLSLPESCYKTYQTSKHTESTASIAKISRFFANTQLPIDAMFSDVLRLVIWLSRSRSANASIAIARQVIDSHDGIRAVTPNSMSIRRGRCGHTYAPCLLLTAD